MAEDKPYSPFGRDPRTTHLTPEDVDKLKANPVEGTTYDNEFESDFERIKASAQSSGFLTDLIFSAAKPLMREAWQHGWSTGFGWQGKVEEAMIDPKGGG